MNLVDKKIIGSELKYVSKSLTDKKIIPNFLVDKNQSNEDLKNLLIALNLVGDYLEKTILKDNNLNLPQNRQHFISSLKNY